MKPRKRDLFLLPLLCSGLISAQSPKWSAAVPPVTANGLHAITLSAELLGSSGFDLGDIRLLDSAGAQVPYLIQEVWAKATTARFVPYVLLRNEVLAHSTVIELERPEGEDLDELHIWIRPVNAEKKIRITGSDDRANWYMVKDDHLVPQGAMGDPPHQVLIVDIPRSDYRYFRLTLNDSLTAPMKVLEVGRFDDGSSGAPRFIDADAFAFAQFDSSGFTVLRVQQPMPVLVERLMITVTDTGRYARNGHVRTWTNMVVGRLRKSHVARTEQNAGSFTLNSKGLGEVNIPLARLDTFDLVIENGDDRPLRFNMVRPRIHQRVLLAQLTSGMRYQLVTGDAAARAPRYDMAHFADELSVPLDTLTHGALTAMAAPAVEGSVFDPSKWWIWVAIIALMLGMGWMAMRMLKKD